MKTLFSLAFAMLLFTTAFAQSPEKISYQSIVRDTTGKIVVNQLVAMKISVIKKTINGTAVYVETHRPKANANGLVTLQIGDGETVFGDFSKINWGDGPFYIKTQIDPSGDTTKTTYTVSGTTQLLSVPYALYANSANLRVSEIGDTLFSGKNYVLIPGISAANKPKVDSINIDSGLVAYYPFTGNADDSSGNGNHGTVNGATLTTDRFGNLSNAYNFNGSGNYIDVKFSNTIAIQESFSSSVWVYLDGGSCNPRVYEIHELTDCGGYTLITWNTSNVSRSFFGGFGKCNVPNEYVSLSSTPNEISALGWHHIAVSIDGVAGIGKLYLDGNLVSTGNSSSISKLNYEGSNLTIGNINGGRCDWFGGKIDDLRLYNRALTPSEITYLATH
jgi:hypothetical protein